MVTKSSANYLNESWDLVDALNSKKLKLEDVKDSELPEKMQKMSQQERETYIKENATRRTKIQDKIQQLNEERKKHVAQEMKKLTNKEATLGSAITQAIREQAEKKNFKFEKKEIPEKKTEEEASK